MRSRPTHTSKTDLSSIAYYITGHGYGHAVRSSEVIRTLIRSDPELTVHVRSTAPRWLFPDNVHYHSRAVDVGIIQRDSLDMDLDATLRACRSLHDDAARVVTDELHFVRNNDIRLIVGDIPPVCFAVAARAAIPSVAIGNFSWDVIYSAYRNAQPRFQALIDEMQSWYATATLALTLPYPCDMDVFSRCEAIPWIARPSLLDKNEARAIFALPERTTVVLLSFGGLGLRRLSRSALQQMRDYVFVITADENRVDGNIIALPAVQCRYQDLVRAADIVITKPGYGIVADCIAHRVPMLYTDRGNFPEYPLLVQGLEDCATASFIPQTDLLAGNFKTHLRQLLEKTPNWPTVQLDGADVAARKICAMLEDFSSAPFCCANSLVSEI